MPIPVRRLLCLALICFGFTIHADDQDDQKILSQPDVVAKVKAATNLPPEQMKPCKLYGVRLMTLKSIYRFLSAKIAGPLVKLEPTSDLHITAWDNLQGLSAPQVDAALASKEVFVQPSTKKFAEDLASKVGGELHAPLTVTASTRSSEYDTDSHCGHADGLSLDIRPFPGKAPNSWFDTNGNYDRSMNKTFIMMLVKNPQVHRVYFNDPQLLTDPDIQALIAKRVKAEGPGFEYKSYTYTYDTPNGLVTVAHDNHIHVEIKPDPKIEALSEKALDRASK